jgi:hypothetical protein
MSNHVTLSSNLSFRFRKVGGQFRIGYNMQTPGVDYPEKRKSVRVPVDFPASFSHETQNYEGRVLHLSVDGALLKSNELINAGEVIELTFELPEQEVKAKARIIWSKPIETTFGMGVFFDDISAEHKAAIESYISDLIQD